MVARKGGELVTQEGLCPMTCHYCLKVVNLIDVWISMTSF